jgi:hypothetical protein
MTGIFIQNEESPAEIVAVDYYGCDFKVSVFNQDDGTYLAQNLSMSELVEPITNAVTTTSGNLVIGDNIVTLTSSSSFSNSDRVKIGNYIYKIISMINDNITLNKPLQENVASGSSVTKKGNLGVYKVDLEFTDLGNFTLIGKDSVYGLNVSKMVKCVPKSIETMYKDIKNLEYAILGN